MSSESPSTKPRSAVRWHVILPICLVFLSVTVLIGFLIRRSGPVESVYDLSSVDGKPRFYRTKFYQETMPPNLPLHKRLAWRVEKFMESKQKRNPAKYSFPATSPHLCSIPSLLEQAMNMSGTQYQVAVEIIGPVNFGYTNVLNGTQWIAAFEDAIAKSPPVLCLDHATKKTFQDTLLVLREKPGVVKIVPQTKLKTYQDAGLVETP